jgi:biotin carboxylase
LVEGSGAPPGKRLLVLGAGPAQLGLLATARELGLHVIALDRDHAAPGFQYADRRAIISTEDEEGIERLAGAEGVEGIIAPGTDWPVAIAARVAARLRLPHPLTPEAAALTVSKIRQRERFAEHGLPQPGWQVVSEAEADVAVAVPCVVKAPDRQGQRGQTLVQSTDELPGAIARALAESRSGIAIVEQIVEGPEVQVGGFSIGGRFFPLTVTDRLTADSPAFGVALTHVWPSEAAGDDVFRVADAVAAAVGITDGPTHLELRIGPGGPQVMELAGRLGGGHNAELCREVVGVDLNALALSAALGEPVEESELTPAPRVGGACVRFLVPPEEGVLREVTGVEEARAVEGVRELWIYREPGHAFGPFRIGADRAGAVLVTGESREQALARADEAARLIRFETVDTEAVV